jgi:competence ComEA-like helix-hairpin-helix protein
MARRFPIRLLSLFLFVGLIFAASLDAGRKKPPAKPVNLNTATSEELQQVPGIGPATADKILQMRKSYGAFKSVDDLLAIRGLGPKRLEKMRKYLIVGKPAAAKPTTPSAKSTPPAESLPLNHKRDFSLRSK